MGLTLEHVGSFCVLGVGAQTLVMCTFEFLLRCKTEGYNDDGYQMRLMFNLLLVLHVFFFFFF